MRPEKIKIYALVDNMASNVCHSEHGLSYLVVFDEKVLFDTGQSKLFLENAAKINAPIQDVKTVVLSHGHYDHGNGLKYLKNMQLLCHPNVFAERFSGKQMKNVGVNISKKEAEEIVEINDSKDPVWLSDAMVFLGEIPRKIAYEKTATRFKLSDGSIDEIPDDSAMAVVMDKGLFVISGCAHSGICNIIEHAKYVTGVDKLYGVMGGFHLKFNNKQTQETLAYFKNEAPEIVMPSHCTELPALSVFYNEFGGEQVRAGTLYTFDN